MKALFLTLLMTFNLHAAIESLNYKILPGKYHLGGSLKAEATNFNSVAKTMDVTVHYDVIKKLLIPAPANVLKNKMVFALPLEFQDERGYLDLEKSKSRDSQYATIQHMGRVKIGQFTDAHRVQIIGKNGKYICNIIYHPTFPELGWIEIKILLNLTLLSNYEIQAVLK